MIKRKQHKDAIWVKNKAEESVLLLIINLMYAENTGQSCLITDVNGILYTFPENVSFLIQYFIGFNLFQIHKSTVVNLNYISIAIIHHFNYKNIIMRDGKPLDVAVSVAKMVKRHYKVLKTKCHSWRELIGWNT